MINTPGPLNRPVTRLKSCSLTLASPNAQLTPNPYISPTLDDTVRREPRRGLVGTTCYLIAAVPALYIFGVLLLCVFGGIAKLLGTGFNFQDAFVNFAVYVGLYATVIQLPLYIGWALLSKEIPRTTRFHWAALLWVGNMVTIPCFLVAKYFRIAGRLPLGQQNSPTG